MYTLTLQEWERRAFDFVGYRYATGEIADILMSLSDEASDYWLEDEPITFEIPEHKAWEIRELAEKENYLWPCFCNSLKTKMQEFCDSII